MHATHLFYIWQVREFLGDVIKEQTTGQKRRPLELSGRQGYMRHIYSNDSSCPNHICHRTKLQEIAELQNRPSTILDIKGKRPVVALQDLEETLGNCPHKRAKWREEARVAAIMGSCPRSKESLASGVHPHCVDMRTYVSIKVCLSGVRHWIRYIKIIYGENDAERQAFPPRLHDILTWSNTFR